MKGVKINTINKKGRVSRWEFASLNEMKSYFMIDNGIRVFPDMNDEVEFCLIENVRMYPDTVGQLFRILGITSKRNSPEAFRELREMLSEGMIDPLSSDPDKYPGCKNCYACKRCADAFMPHSVHCGSYELPKSNI